MNSDDPIEKASEGEDDTAAQPNTESSAWRIGMPRNPSTPAGGSHAAQQDSAAEDPDDADDLQDGFTHEGRSDEFEQDDPLAPAYDLERGTPLSVNEPLDVLPHRARIKTAKEFFNTEILYRYDILEAGDRDFLRGSYRIELRGAQGGIWSITLADSLTVVNNREEADIVLTMQQRDFLQLVNGQLNPQLAIFAQKLKITGDLKKGVLFQNLLTPQTD